MKKVTLQIFYTGTVYRTITLPDCATDQDIYDAISSYTKNVYSEEYKNEAKENLEYTSWEHLVTDEPPFYNHKPENTIYFIENTIDEYGHTKNSGYYTNFNEALSGLENCADFYRALGTGKIYELEIGLDKEPKLVFER